MSNKGAAGACAIKGTEERRKPHGPHEGRGTRDERNCVPGWPACPTLSPAHNEGRKTKVYNFSMPTKTTKTTKSLVVVLRFCSKLSDRKNGFSCDATHALLAHCLRGTQCTPGGAALARDEGCGCRERKSREVPGSRMPGKAFAPVACANRGQRAI